MHLSDMLKEEMVWPDLEATTKPEVIRELARRMAQASEDLDESRVAEVLMERERLGSTGIQDGIAIPHGKVPGLEHIVLACGRCPHGVDFEAHDGMPTTLFFVLLAPESAAGQHLKVLARLSKLLKSAAFRDRLLSADDGRSLYAAIVEEDQKL